MYQDFGLEPGLEGRDQLDATFQLRGGWELNGHLDRNFVHFQDSSFADYTVGSATGPAYQAEEKFSGLVWQTRVTTPTWQQLGAVLLYQTGKAAIFEEGTTGSGWFLNGTLNLRPASTVRIAASATVFRLDRLDGSEFARATIPRLKLEYQPTRSLFFRAIGEYRSEQPRGAAGSSHGRLALRGRTPPAGHPLRRTAGGSARLLRADPGHGGVPGVRQLAGDGPGVQLVESRASERRVLPEAGVSDTAVAGRTGGTGGNRYTHLIPSAARI